MRSLFPPALLLAIALTACDNSGNFETRVPEHNGDDYFPGVEEPGAQFASEEFSFHAQTVIDGLTIPWSMAFLPDGVVLITERHGTLRLVRNGELDSMPVGGTPDVFAQGQGGLLDIALHPEHENNGWIYLAFSDPGDDGAHTALMRARLDIDDHTLTAQEVLFSGTPKTSAGRHFGTRIVFHDGYVFLSTGDRGDMDEAQNLTSHHGTVIRLHDDGSVPDDNPFLEEPDALPEIWSYGHRNVQGMALRPGTGDLWSHEHGPQGGDEINIIREGRNYGWPLVTYGIDYDGTPIADEPEMEGMEPPVIHWTPSIAPSGMAFVQGDRYPAWQGNLLAGALVGQELRRVVLDGDAVVHQESLLLGLGRIRDVRMAPDGYIYIANESNGSIARLVPVE